jgi:aldehyde:ferredoxin oxidoreductase
MKNNHKSGYGLRILRVNLSKGQTDVEEISDDMARKYVGGTGLGAKYLYEEVPPGVEWSHPDNRIMFFTGPLAGTKVAGSGTFSVISKGPMTNMAGASQANGFFGAFLRSSGFHGVIVQGAAKKWTRLHIHDGRAELLDAADLLGKDTWETEDAVRSKTGKRCSTFSIGPAGENLVRFAAIVGDRGHVAAHNGLGAVMGSKKLKAISAERDRTAVPVAEPARLSEAAKTLLEVSKKMDPMLCDWGTPQLFMVLDKLGALPIRNYTTNIFPDNEKFAGQYIRTHFKVKPAPCWACGIAHCRMMEVTEGPYKGFKGEEPEYEGMAGMGPVIGQTDPGSAVMLANLADRLGMDVNEAGWMIGWLMECYEKRLLNKNDLDGVELQWGNVEATVEMLTKIAHRQGCGKVWAEGVKRAAEGMGGDALNCAIYTEKGASPRTHDHRAVWQELVDTCCSNTGTIEVVGGNLQPGVLGVNPLDDRFDPGKVAAINAKLNGRRQFDDCLGACRFCLADFQPTIDCLNAVTGWEFTIPEAMDVGRRIVNQLRLFNFRHGLTKEIEKPSLRYASTPVDGPAKGISIMPHWEFMRRTYYQNMGWDPETGRPLAETLEKVGLAHLIQDLKVLNGR